jgi:hypothetical protein
VNPRWRLLLLAVVLGSGAGCASSPHSSPHPTGAPPADQAPATPPASAETPPDVGATQPGLSNTYSGASDSTGGIPGAPDALYRYRFQQTQPGSSGFTYYDRDLSFYFRPSPDALYFQVQNKQARQVQIDWEKSVFYDPRGRTSKVAHAPTRWKDRYSVQTPTVVIPLQTYSDYLLPMDLLLDPAGSDQQLHLPLLREDQAAPQFSGATFGADLVFVIEDRPRTYSFRFKVASVIPINR